MVWYVAITLYFLGAVIAVWGITLLRRVWRGRGMGRGRQRQDGSVAVGVRQPRRVLAGAVGVICVPLGIALVVVGDSARRGFEGWDGIPSKAWGIGATVVCLIFGAVLVYAGVRFDPAAGRRRCPRCWYDMGGTTGMRCTECGRAAKSERRLRRTRRCKRLVAAGLLLGVTPFVVRTAEVAVKDGWQAAVPTTALIVAFPYLPDDMVSNSQGSLAARLGSGRASAWQKSLFQRRRAWAMSRATDFGLVSRCIYLGYGGANVKPSPAGIDAIYTTALGGSPDSSSALILLQSMNLMAAPGMEERCAREAIEAMESRVPLRAVAGAIVPRYCGSKGELAVPAILALALDRTAEPQSRYAAVATLVSTVSQWESSREAYPTLIREIDAPFRPAALSIRLFMVHPAFPG